MNIVIIDYRAGNSASIMNAFEKLGVTASVSASPSDWRKADAIVFPGVGSFGSAMKYLGKDSAVLRQLIAEGVPFLGICLGMQVLMDWSEESPAVPGLGIIPGIARRFPEGLPVPQIGWNKVRVGSSPIFEGLKEFYAYFVNSYYCVPEDRSWVAATAAYGECFPSAFRKGNVFATQFHPEKSGGPGLKVLENFIREVRRCE